MITNHSHCHRLLKLGLANHSAKYVLSIMIEEKMSVKVNIFWDQYKILKKYSIKIWQECWNLQPSNSNQRCSPKYFTDLRIYWLYKKVPVVIHLTISLYFSNFNFYHSTLIQFLFSMDRYLNSPNKVGVSMPRICLMTKYLWHQKQPMKSAKLSQKAPWWPN